MKIIADNKIPFLKNVFEPFMDVEYVNGDKITNKVCKDADALIIRTRTKCNSDLLDNTSVKFISSATIGMDHIDGEYCVNNGIEFSNAPGCNSEAVKQWVLSALLKYAESEEVDLTNKTLGVIGVGRIGSKIVRLAELLGMQVLLNDPPRARNEGRCGFVSLQSILRECDIISLHVPLIQSGKDRTFHLMNTGLFNKMNTGTLIINSSRGEVINNKELMVFLRTNTKIKAVLDVWENEPDINHDLLHNILLATPHIAGYSIDGKANASAMAVQAVSKYFNLPLNDWYPDDDILNTSINMTIDVKDKTLQHVLTEVISKQYDITKDDQLLKSQVAQFEKIRNNYPLRLEPVHYQIEIMNDINGYGNLLKELGFKVLI